MQDLKDMKKMIQEARVALKEANRQSQEVRASVHQAQNCLDKASNLVLTLEQSDARPEEMSELDYLDLRVREMQAELDSMRIKRLAEEAPPPRGSEGIACEMMPVRPDKTSLSAEMVRKARLFSEDDYERRVRAINAPTIKQKLSTDDFAKEAESFKHSAFRSGD